MPDLATNNVMTLSSISWGVGGRIISKRTGGRIRSG